MQFFFDYTTKGKALIDYHGEEFGNTKDAVDFAEETAHYLKNSLNGDWRGWSVEVRNAERTEYFSLPVDSGQEFTTNANAGSDNFAKNPSSLLIIEDALVHSVIISHIARKLEFTTTVAPSYEAACKVLGERQFDCVTLDLGLGEHAGLDVLRYLSTIECRAQIIVVSH
jgi:PleD family two-component response regulator